MRNIPQRGGNVGSAVHQTNEPVVLVIVWGSRLGENTKLGGEGQVGTVRTCLVPTSVKARGQDLIDKR